MASKGPEDSFVAVMENGLGVGAAMAYVDDFLVMGKKDIVQDTLDKLTSMWRTSSPEWVNKDRWMKFCGFCGLQLKWRDGALLLGQPDYAREILNR